MAESENPFDLKGWADKYEARYAKGSNISQSDLSITSSPSFTQFSETSPRPTTNNASINQHERHSDDFGSNSVDPSLRGGSAENSQEPNDTPMSPTGQPITSTCTLGRRSWILFTMLVALALAIAHQKFPAMDSDISVPQSDDCYNQSSVHFITGYSFPDKFDIVTHKAILEELGDVDLLGKLVLLRSKLDSSLESKDLLSRLTCAIKGYSSKRVELVYDQIEIVQTQINLTNYHVSELLDIYRLLRSAYHEHKTATAKAVQAVRLDNRHHLAIKAQPCLLHFIGLDAKKSFLDPWTETSKKWEEAQSGTIALNGEIQRLEQIAQVAQKQSEQLGQLVQETTVKGERRDNVVGSDESTRQRLKQWFRQNIVQHIGQDGEALTESKFDSWWENLCCVQETHDV